MNKSPSNHDFKELVKENKELRNKLEILEAEASSKRQKQKQKRDPLTAEIYKELIKEADGPGYLKARLRVALLLLTISGVTINEILALKVGDIKPLIDEGWLSYLNSIYFHYRPLF